MPKVTIFSTTTCKYCKEVKEYLTDHNIGYEEILLDQRPEFIAESVALSGSRGVPVTKVVRDDGTMVGVLGWDQPALAEALQLA